MLFSHKFKKHNLYLAKVPNIVILRPVVVACLERMSSMTYAAYLHDLANVFVQTRNRFVSTRFTILLGNLNYNFVTEFVNKTNKTDKYNQKNKSTQQSTKQFFFCLMKDIFAGRLHKGE